MNSRVERINGAVNACSDVFEHFVATWAVPVADGVVAVLAANNMATTLGFPLSVSVMAGIALEGVGIVSSKAALECHYYNQTRNNKPPVLEGLAWTVAGVQFAVGFALILVNAVMVDRMVLGLLSIGVLSATGTLAHMLRSDVRARQSQQQPAPVVASVAEEPPTVDDIVDAFAQPDKRQRLAAYFVENPHATNASAARMTGIPASTVRVWRQEMIEAGEIEHNGTGGR